MTSGHPDRWDDFFDDPAGAPPSFLVDRNAALNEELARAAVVGLDGALAGKLLSEVELDHALSVTPQPPAA